MHYVNDINLVPKMGQIIKVQQPVSSTSISGLYVILEAAFTIALLGVLLYNMWYSLTMANDRSVVFSGYSGFLHQ
jgi:hypothetical protein